MSRFNAIDNDGNDIAYGIDIAFGRFYTKYDKNHEIIVDKNNLSRIQLMTLLRTSNAPEIHIYNIAADLHPDGIM
ncbi:hypothetical protein GW931_02800 [archaeon]|nr:hypothetical protein [archaeon]